MKKTTLLCMVIASLSLSPINNFLMKNNETSWHLCTEKVIEKMFKNGNLYYICNKKGNDLLPFHVNNPKAIINIDRSINLTIPSKWGFSHNYVIALESVNSFKRYVRGTLERISLIKYHYLNGRVLVITDQATLVKTIFSLLWEWEMIYFAVLVIDRSQNTQSLFTANPQDTQNNCGKRPDLIYKQSCDNANTDSILKPIRNYNKCPAKIHTVLPNEFNEFSRMSYTASFMTDILNLSLKTIQFVANVPNNDYDHITITDLVLQKTNYDMFYVSHVYSRETLVWIVPPTEPIWAMEILVIPFKKVVWLAVFVVLVLFISAWFVLNNSKTRLGEIIVQTLSITLFSSTNRIPNSSKLRFLIMCYIIYSVHIQTAYVSNLTRLLTSPPMRKPIQSLKELLETDVPICIDYLSDMLLTMHNTPDMQEVYELLSKRLSCGDEHDSIKLMELWKTNANFCLPMLLDTLNALELILQIRTPYYFIDNRTSGPAMKVLGALQSTYVIDSLNEIIVWMTEIGLYNKQDSDRQFDAERKKSRFISPDEVKKLSIEHLGGIFLLYIFGVAVSLVAFIGELTVHF